MIMKDTVIRSRMEKIRDKYKYIQYLTESYLADPEDAGLVNLLRERERFLTDIAAENAYLVHIGGSDHLSPNSISPIQKPLLDEIHTVVYEIRKADMIIEKKIRTRQSEIQYELSNLYGKSKATRAYTSNSAL